MLLAVTKVWEEFITSIAYPEDEANVAPKIY
jgi:hypothetical protein